MENIKLTDNLTLLYISEYSTDIDDDELKLVHLEFSFFGQNAEAYLQMKSLDNDYLSYQQTESSSELHASFNRLIEEDEDVTSKIRKSVKEFQIEWIKEIESYDE